MPNRPPDPSNAPTPDPAHWPRWCCAILRDSRGWYILEARPPHEPDSPGTLTCFGGGREPGEHPEACLRRELIEELDFVAGALDFCVELSTPKGIAWFYRGLGPEHGQARALEPGFGVEWIAPDALLTAPLGTWNLAAILADLRGERQARAD